MQIICFVAFSSISKTKNLIHDKVSNFWSPPPTDLSFLSTDILPSPRNPKSKKESSGFWKKLSQNPAVCYLHRENQERPCQLPQTTGFSMSLTLTKEINSSRNLIRHGHTEEFIPIEIIVLRHEPPSTFDNFSNFIHYRDTTNDPFAQSRPHF